MRNTRWSVAGLAAMAGALLLTACTGVPASSAPQVIDTVGMAPPQQPVVSPPKDANPREIVQLFFQDAAANDGNHAAARAFLTSEERNRWNDSAQTVVLDAVHFGSFDPIHDQVIVSGHQLGLVDSNGVYTPTVQQHSLVEKTIKLQQVGGQWRISSTFQGVLVSENQFNVAYSPRVVYFWDQAEKRIVPDLRYSALLDPQALATWLMAQLASPPSGSSLNTDLPSIPDVSQLKVTVGKVVAVELPGADQLGADTKMRMAAQIALTIDQAVPNAQMRITDGGRPVTIPKLQSTVFNATQFTSDIQPATSSPALYFVHDGGIRSASGDALPGALGSGADSVNSVALATTPSSSRLRVAIVSGQGASAKLYVGQVGQVLKPVNLSGSMSRPSWVPGRDEVWIGAGDKLYRVGADAKARTVAFQSGSVSVSGRIIAVRISPEGSRIALVIATAGGQSQIWIGVIARGSQSVQVTDMELISPNGANITDVGWSDLLKLYAIGTDTASGDPNVYELECDGSFWSATGIGNLPQAPDSLAVAKNGVPAVSAGTTIWVQTNGIWVSPEQGTTYGTNPVYVE